MIFHAESMTPEGRTRQQRVEADSREAAVATLRQQGLLPVRLTAVNAAPSRSSAPARPGAARPAELLMMCRQLSMLLGAGASVVPALEAVENQTGRPAFRAVLTGLRQEVEAGRSLSESLDLYPQTFSSVFRSIVATGEATATLPAVLDRLVLLLSRQHATRNALVSALVYPILLMVLAGGVVLVLLTFVVPRFETLFGSLGRPLPDSTQLLFSIASGMSDHWPWFAGGLLATAAGAVAAIRHAPVRAAIGGALLRAPGVGRLLGRMEVARFLRIWATMLAARLPLLEVIEHSRGAVRLGAYQRLLERVREGVTSGEKIGPMLAASGFVEPVVVSALTTGEENGRLADSAEFVSTWLDEENQQMLGRIARLAEPLLLTGMGVVVGLISMALFLPLFDMATGG